MDTQRRNRLKALRRKVRKRILLCYAISFAAGVAVYLIYSRYETDTHKVLRRSLSASGIVFLFIGGYNLLSKNIGK